MLTRGRGDERTSASAVLECLLDVQEGTQHGRSSALVRVAERERSTACGADEWIGVLVRDHTLEDDQRSDASLPDASFQVADGVSALPSRVYPLQPVAEGDREPLEPPPPAGAPHDHDGSLGCLQVGELRGRLASGGGRWLPRAGRDRGFGDGENERVGTCLPELGQGQNGLVQGGCGGCRRGGGRGRAWQVVGGRELVGDVALGGCEVRVHQGVELDGSFTRFPATSVQARADLFDQSVDRRAVGHRWDHRESGTGRRGASSDHRIRFPR